MKSNDSKKKPREKSKTRAWEKGRRDRLSECFTKLQVVLPNYDASKKLSKIEILLSAASTIKDFDDKLKKLLISPENEKGEEQKVKVSGEIIKKLQDRVKKLLVRNEELVNLLKHAGITVPSVFGAVKKIRTSYKLTNKITVSQAKILQKELEKENQIKPPKSPKPKKPKRSGELKFKKASPNSKVNKSLKRQVTNLVSSPNCLFIVSQPRLINNSCYIVSKGPRKVNQTAISSSLLIKTPIVSSNIKPSILSTNPPLTDLRAGTLVFANGTVMPVVPPPPPLPVLPTIFTNPIQTNLPAFIVVSCNTKTSCTNKISMSPTTKSTVTISAGSIEPVFTKMSYKDLTGSLVTRPILKPKTCITRTTQINKVPIPALSSRYNTSSCLASIKTQNVDKNNKLPILTNEIKKPKENISNLKLNKKRVLEKPQQGAKKPKSNKEENKKNLGEHVSATNVQNNDKINNDNDKASVVPNESEKTVSVIIDKEKVEKKLETNKEEPTSNENIKILSVFNLEKEPSNSICELEKSPIISVKPLEELTSNQGSLGNPVTSSSVLDSAEPNEMTNRHVTEGHQTLCITENGKNKTAIEEEIQAPMYDKTKEISEPISVEGVTAINTSVTSVCNKQELKTFEVNISQSESVTKNNNTNDLKTLEINLPQSELSNDIFASFQVPSGCQNPGSTSPTAAFLLAFPLVSSGTKVTEVIGDENSESHAGTPNLLQIGTMDISKSTQSFSDSLTPNILNFENFSFFSNKDNCSGFYNNCSVIPTTCQTSVSVTSNIKVTSSFNNITVPSQNIVGNGNQVEHTKLNTTDNLKYLPVSKTESNIKSLNRSDNYKTNMAEKVPTNIKSSNVNTNHDPLQSSKDLKAQPYNSTPYNFAKNTELGNITTNILNTNTNSFSSKIASDENYPNKMKSDVSAQHFVSKSSDSCTNYSGYNYCTSFDASSVALNKNYNPVYTCAANNYFYNSSGSSVDNRNFNPSSCNNYTDYRKTENYNNYNEGSQVFNKDKFNQNVQSKIKSSSTQNKPINWMTSPSTTVSYKPEYFLPPFSKESNFNPNLSTNTSFTTLTSNTYFNSSSVYNPNDHLNNTPELRKTVDLNLPTYSSYQRIESEDNQFSWSPNKMPQFLDPSHSHAFVSSTLPTLVGDLALNNTPNLDQKNSKDKNRDNRRRTGNCDNQNSQTNFLSVSQLVEHNQEHVPAKIMSRRSSGNRSKTNTPKTKRLVNRSDVNKDLPSCQKNDKVSQQKHYDNISVATNLFNEAKQQPRNNKNVPSSYSAEALIGNQLSSNPSAKRNIPNHNKSIVPNFLSENIVSYFPAVEVSQDNNYMQTNQSFQANSFSQNFATTFQNSTYGPNNFIPSACTITSTYIPSNNFMHSSNTQEFIGDNSNLFQNINNVQTKDKNNYMKNYYRQTDKNEKNQAYTCKKAKKRSTNESALPSFDIPFLSMPGNINSPILPDDFHTTYLTPTTLYSCKNPLYSKPNSEITPSTFIPSLPAITGTKSGVQHSDMSPSVNSVGTSLTNFNLSTIFPEINKGPVQDTFSENRNKDYQPASKSFSMSSSLQVPFSSKSSIPFGSFGT